MSQRNVCIHALCGGACASRSPPGIPLLPGHSSLKFEWSSPCSHCRCRVCPSSSSSSTTSNNRWRRQAGCCWLPGCPPVELDMRWGCRPHCRGRAPQQPASLPRWEAGVSLLHACLVVLPPARVWQRCYSKITLARCLPWQRETGIWIQQCVIFLGRVYRSRHDIGVTALPAAGTWSHVVRAARTSPNPQGTASATPEGGWLWM